MSASLRRAAQSNSKLAMSILPYNITLLQQLAAAQQVAAAQSAPVRSSSLLLSSILFSALCCVLFSVLRRVIRSDSIRSALLIGESLSRHSQRRDRAVVKPMPCERLICSASSPANSHSHSQRTLLDSRRAVEWLEKHLCVAR